MKLRLLLIIQHYMGWCGVVQTCQAFEILKSVSRSHAYTVEISRIRKHCSHVFSV